MKRPNKTKRKRTAQPSLQEVLSTPPIPEGRERDAFYDLQDMLGIHWFTRPLKQ